MASPGEKVQIKRYPNRRLYARGSSKYVSLAEIEEMIRAGQTVEIHDSQSGDDLTRSILTQIILERQPEKMALFPVDMLHFILQSNDLMSDFLRDYFHHSLTYLEYLRRHNPAAATLQRPMHWVRAWLDAMVPKPSTGTRGKGRKMASDESDESGRSGGSDESAGDLGSVPDDVARRMAVLEKRLRELETDKASEKEKTKGRKKKERPE